MEKDKKNPMLAGLFNMLAPGSIHMYLGKEWRKFILTFIGTELALAIAIWLGISLQRLSFFNIPTGLCPGALALIVLVPLFRNGLNAATEHNKSLDDADLYQSRKPVSQDGNEEKMEKLQKMRDEGLISEQQFSAKKNQVDSKK